MKTGDIFSRNLRVIREAKGFTQKSLAEKVGLNDQAIREYESGRRVPSLDKIGQIASELGVSVPRMFESGEPPLVRELPVSKTLQKMMNIPDEVYTKAGDFPPDHEVWGILLGVMKDSELREEAKRAKEKASRSQSS